MNSHNLKRLILSNSRGSVLVLVGLLLVVFIGVAALAIDIGHLSTSKNELQNAADAAALAASRKLGNIYQNMAAAGQGLTGYNVNDNGDKAVIIAVAKDVAFQNKAARESIQIDENRVPTSDIQIGVWNPDPDDPNTDPFNPQDDRPNAVRVTVHRDADNASGQITTFFTGVFGIDSAPVSAQATAALTGQGTSEPGELQLPIGLSRKWFDGSPSEWCGNVVKFSPPTDDDACAGWTGFDLKNATPGSLQSILSEEHTTPESAIGDSFYYTNAVSVSDAFKNLLIVYGNKGHAVDSVYQYDPEKNYDEQVIPQPVNDDSERKALCRYDDGALTVCNDTDIELQDVHLRYPYLDINKTDGGNQQKNFTGPFRYAHEWETTMVVYDSDDCTPSQDIPIKGYVRVVLYDVGYPSNAYVYARVTCDTVSPEETRGGGSSFGLMGSIPSLVE